MHLVQERERAFPLRTPLARRHRRVVADHVRLQPPRLHVLQERERALPLRALLARRDGRVEAESIGLDRAARHLVEQREGVLPPPGLLACRDRRAEADHVRLRSARVHLVEERERFLPPPDLLARRDGRVVADHVGLEPARSHLLQQRERLLPERALSTRRDGQVEAEDRGLHAGRPHLLKQRDRACRPSRARPRGDGHVELLGVAQALEAEPLERGRDLRGLHGLLEVREHAAATLSRRAVRHRVLVGRAAQRSPEQHRRSLLLRERDFGGLGRRERHEREAAVGGRVVGPAREVHVAHHAEMALERLAQKLRVRAPRDVPDENAVGARRGPHGARLSRGLLRPHPRAHDAEQAEEQTHPRANKRSPHAPTREETLTST